MNRGMFFRRVPEISALVFAVLLLLSFTTSAVTAAEAGQKERQQPYYRASSIIDHEVKGGRGEELGEVDDLILRRNGRIRRVILQVGGFLGIGDRLVAVSFKSLRIQAETIAYPATKEQLEKYREFDYRDAIAYPALQYPGGYGPYGPYRYRGYGPYVGRPGPYRQTTPGKQPDRGPYPPPPWEWSYFPDQFRASPLLGSIVVNYEGYRLGEIEDLLINKDGIAQDAVLSVDDRLIALPFKALDISYFGIYYDISQDQLKQLPTFTWPETRP